MSSKKGGSTPPVPNVVAIAACHPQVLVDTVSALEQLLEAARAGTVTGLAVAVLRAKGNFSLKLCGTATEDGNLMPWRACWPHCRGWC